MGSGIKMESIRRGLVWSLVVLVVVAIGAYFLSTYLEHRAKKKAEREEAERIESSVKLALDQMVSRFNAVDDWPEKLCEGGAGAKRVMMRTKKLLIVDLEKLWIGNRPILFVGSIQDISSIDENTYRLRLERSFLFYGFESAIISDELGLELKCSKSMLDRFLKNHPDLFSQSGLLHNRVAVIADITQVKKEYFSGAEGGEKEVKVGVGGCLDITYVGYLPHSFLREKE